MTYQSLVIVGNVGKEPEMRYTPSGQPVTSFSVATNRSYQNPSGEKIDETTWFRVTTWGKLAETCNQFLHKGRQVLVEGRLVPDKNGGPRIWTRQDGTPGASFEITANTVRFLGQKGEGAGEPMADGIGDAGGGDDIPF
jgi:single-strand DNA-binding protein